MILNYKDKLVTVNTSYFIQSMNEETNNWLKEEIDNSCNHIVFESIEEKTYFIEQVFNLLQYGVLWKSNKNKTLCKPVSEIFKATIPSYEKESDNG